MSLKPHPTRWVVFGNPPSTVQLRSTPISDCSPWIWRNPPARPSSLPPPQPPLQPPAIAPTSRDDAHSALRPVLSPGSDRPSTANVNKSKRGLQQTLDNLESSSQSLDSTKRRKIHVGTTPAHEISTEDSTGDTTGDDSSKMEYYESQLEHRDIIEEESADSSRLSSSGEKEDTSCFLEPSPEHTQELTFSESLVVNLPEFHFDARGCTPLDKLSISSNRLYNLLFLLTDKHPLITIDLKKPRRNGVTSAELAHFECIDDSGATIKLALWDHVAVELETPCFVGDIIYLSAIAISTYQDRIQGSTTKGTRAQICYRFKPTHHTHVKLYQPDMRLAYDPTTRRVKQLVEWARLIYDD